MNSLKWAELISMGLTAPTIILGLCVVFMWGKDAIKAIRLPPSSRNPTQWFIMGVALGFLGAVLDNFYWAIPWTADFIGHESADYLFTRGVYFNIFSRQMCGVISAYCHIKSALLYKSKDARGKLSWITGLSMAIGVVYVFIMVALKGIS